ncbi:MAG: TolC family protein [Myxococcales bacterium]
MTTIEARPRAGRLQRPRLLRGAPGWALLLCCLSARAQGQGSGAAAKAAAARGSTGLLDDAPAKPKGKAAGAAPATSADAAQPADTARAGEGELAIPNSSLRGPPPPEGPPLTLRDLIERARLVDPRARQALAQLEHAHGRRGEAFWAWFPTFDTTIGVGGPTSEARLAGGDRGPLDVLTPGSVSGWGRLGIAIKASTQAILPLYTFGKYDSGTAAAAHAVKAQEHLLARARDQSTFDVVRAYWGYQTTHFGLAAIEGVRKQISDARKRAQELLDDGSDQLTRADLTRIDYVAEEVEAQHAGSVKNEALALTSLKLITGESLETPLNIARQELPQPPAQPDFEAMVRLGLAQRPEARAAHENVAARTALVELERARYYPDLGLVGGASYNYQSNASSPSNPFVNNPNSRGLFIALGLKGTFDFPQKFYRVRQVEADLREAQALLAGSESLLRLDLQQALGDLAEARVRAQRYGKESAIARQLLVQAALAFDSGLGSAQDLVLDTFLYSRATGEKLRALFDAQIAWASLEKAVGTEVTQVPGPAPAPATTGAPQRDAPRPASPAHRR